MRLCPRNKKGVLIMKKILTVALMALLAVVMTVSAFADPGAFVESPSGNAAPVLVEGKNMDEDCPAQLVIVSYSDRFTLSAEAVAALEAAYASVVGTTDLGTLNSDLDELAGTLSIGSEQLAVSDLFEVYYTDCDTHEDHKEFVITVKPNTLENFAGILHYENGQWVLLESEVKDGELTFVTDSLSPFAIVVHDGTAVAPAAGFPGWAIALIVVAVVGIGVVVVLLLLKKNKKEDEKAAAAK